MRGARIEPVRVVVLLACLASTCSGAAQVPAPAGRIRLTIDATEAEAVLAILSRTAAGETVPEAAWRRLFESEPYVRLKRREESLDRAFTDEDFRKFVLAPERAREAPALARTLDAWKKADLVAAAERVMAYLPGDAVIRAKVYPVVKPQPNSFVFEVRSDPAIFLYLDPTILAGSFENTVAHELHHIGNASLGGRFEKTFQGLEPPVRQALEWVGAFGEGFAMLAAAGSADVHPHAASAPEDRARWDRDMARFDEDLRSVERFFLDVVEGRLTGEKEISERAFSFFGVQGPWYTVGYRMATVIERDGGRAALVDCMSDPRKLLSTYNRAAARSAEHPALWSAELLAKLRVPAGVAAIPASEAAAAFALVKRISDQDAGRLWGVPVCGPVLFGDPESGEVVGNQADSEGKLRRSDGVWVGTLPKDVRLANTAMEWAGVRWTTVMWPLPADTRDEARLLAHECFHRIQPALKLPAEDAIAGHLDGRDGRTWMLLEWRALERALLTTGARRKGAIADALRFRSWRRTLLPNGAESERRLELNEGLSEYTGVRLAQSDEADRRGAAVALLRGALSRPSLVRSFAYASGPAYGLLLDASGIAWRNGLTAGSDLGSLLAKAYAVPERPQDPASALAAAHAYGGEAVIATEALRARKLEEKLAAARRRFVEGPVLVLPVTSRLQYGFNPNDLMTLDIGSTVYPWLRASDDWGVLEAGGGMLVRENGAVARIVVPAPVKAEGSAVSGDGWTLELKPGFRLAAGARAGDQVVTTE